MGAASSSVLFLVLPALAAAVRSHNPTPSTVRSTRNLLGLYTPAAVGGGVAKVEVALVAAGPKQGTVCLVCKQGRRKGRGPAAASEQMGQDKKAQQSGKLTHVCTCTRATTQATAAQNAREMVKYPLAIGPSFIYMG